MTLFGVDVTMLSARLLPLLTPPTTLEFAMKPRRDTRARNLVFLITIVSALVVGLWLAR